MQQFYVQAMAHNNNSQPVQVYFNDLDALGMVNHAYYAVLVDRAWWPFWAERGCRPYSLDARQVIREMTVTYHAPITEVGEVSVELYRPVPWGNEARRDMAALIRPSDTGHESGPRRDVVETTSTSR